MKQLLLLLMLMLLTSTLCFAKKCNWNQRGWIKTKVDALERCGRPDMVSQVGIVSGNLIQEEWIYLHSDGTTSTLLFTGNRLSDFDYGPYKRR